MNKNKNVPFIDEKGVCHKKEYIGRKQDRKMDFSKVPKTRIALKFSYIGKNYQGLVIQSNTDNTVEQKLFDALKKCWLIDPEAEIK